MKSYSIYIVTLLFCISVFAQKDTDVLLQINEEAITVAEFKQVYLKNIELLQDDTKKDPKAYLDLFIPYKLKVQEAYTLGLDKKKTYKDELAGYKTQLAKTFLTDVSLTDKMVREAYDRLVTEISARHILIQVAANATAADTLVAYTKITEARNKVLGGEDFIKIAKKYSDDPSAQVNGGDLGWFKAFKMVYPFETAAYNTDVDQVSMPFKTSFGYHIVQTTGKRRAEGAIEVSHIMILAKQQDSTINPKERIDKIYDLLQKGEDFGSLAKTYSEDRQTASKGGAIRPFERGQLSSKEFENAAFALEKAGAISKPFESKFGWHIAKLIKRLPVKSFEEEQRALEERVTKDRRSQVISQVLTEKLAKQYDQEDISSVIALVSNKVSGEFKNDKWVYNASVSNYNKRAFTLKDSVYTLEGLARFLERSYNPNRFTNQEVFFNEMTRRYVDLKTQAYHEEHLEELEPEFAAVVREYKEGLLIFDLMDQHIWNKAKTDSTGLQGFYTSNKENYRAAKKAVSTVYTSQNKDALTSFRSDLLSNAENALEKIPSDILKTARDIEINKSTTYAARYNPQEGISQVLDYNNGYALYAVSKIEPERTKTLDEARGQVISDYQQQLEKNWIEQLKSNARIDIDKKVLKKLIKQLK